MLRRTPNESIYNQQQKRMGNQVYARTLERTLVSETLNKDYEERSRHYLTVREAEISHTTKECVYYSFFLLIQLTPVGQGDY